MKKPSGKRAKRFEEQPVVEVPVQDFQPRKAKPLKPMTENQARYINAIERSVITFGYGSAGTGKTYIATTMAAQYLTDKKVDRIIITRPVVEAGESLGFLPGEMNEKFDPYFAPLREVLGKNLGPSYVEYLIKAKRIVALPLAYMRGHTFEDAFVILDEAQNTSPVQMKLFLTRIGENAKVVVNGDTTQQDIKGDNGLDDGIYKTRNITGISSVRFEDCDVVRSGICGEIVRAYNSANAR